jgi:amidophosphoribosyltransferase
MIGADSLDYLTIDNLLETFGEGKGFCLGCFKGVYPVSTPIEIGKDHLER